MADNRNRSSVAGWNQDMSNLTQLLQSLDPQFFTQYSSEFNPNYAFGKAFPGQGQVPDTFPVAPQANMSAGSPAAQLLASSWATTPPGQAPQLPQQLGGPPAAPISRTQPQAAPVAAPTTRRRVSSKAAAPATPASTVGPQLLPYRSADMMTVENARGIAATPASTPVTTQRTTVPTAQDWAALQMGSGGTGVTPADLNFSAGPVDPLSLVGTGSAPTGAVVPDPDQAKMDSASMFGNINTGLNAANSLMNLLIGSYGLWQARDAHNQNMKVSNANLSNSISDYNQRQTDAMRTRVGPGPALDRALQGRLLNDPNKIA